METPAKKPPAPAGPPGTRTLRKIGNGPVLAAVALVLILVLSSATGWWWWTYSAKAAEQAGYRTWRLGSLVVNIANTDGRRYLKTTIEFGVASGGGRKLLEELRPHLTDVSLSVLATAPLPELLEAEQRNTVKRRLLDRLNAELKGPVLTQVLFTEFIVQ